MRELTQLACMRENRASLASAQRILGMEGKVYDRFPSSPSSPSLLTSPCLFCSQLQLLLVVVFRQRLHTLTQSLLIPASLAHRPLATSPLRPRSHTSTSSTLTLAPHLLSRPLTSPAALPTLRTVQPPASVPGPSFPTPRLSVPSSLWVSAPPAIRRSSLPPFLLRFVALSLAHQSPSRLPCPITLLPSIVPSPPQHEAQSASSNTTSPSLPPPPPLPLAAPPFIAPRPPSLPLPAITASTQMMTKSARGSRR